MRRIALISLLVPACFYVDPINQRPEIGIVQVSQGPVYRNETMVQLRANAHDPEGDPVSLQWRAYLCTDAAAHDGCDQATFFSQLQIATESSADVEFMVPPVREDVPAAPVQAVLVLLAGSDEVGAAARPVQQLIIPISDHAPDLTLGMDGRHGYVLDMPIDLFASVGDVDDGPENTILDWQVFTPPTQPTFDLVDEQVMQHPTDLAHHQSGKLFTPHGLGDWKILVTASDPLQMTDQKELDITVVSDHAPCLAQWAPIAPPASAQPLPISEPTLFDVLVVVDDLDVFPPVPSDPILGETTFAWSILPPGATTRQPITGVTGNRVPLDPATYHPGDIVELRVEIQDRNATPINCADASPTCSVISDATCIQRLTWRIEMD